VVRERGGGEVQEAVVEPRECRPWQRKKQQPRRLI